MHLYRVTFMNHIVETYVVQAPSEREAWSTDPGDVESEEPDHWDCTMCEVMDVEQVDERDFQELPTAN